jgi:hypothetical protein
MNARVTNESAMHFKYRSCSIPVISTSFLMFGLIPMDEFEADALESHRLLVSRSHGFTANVLDQMSHQALKLISPWM